jgi:hypothetical protein
VIRWFRSETIAMIGSPAVRESMDSTERSLRLPAECARSPIEINTAKLAKARRSQEVYVNSQRGGTIRLELRVRIKKSASA